MMKNLCAILSLIALVSTVWSSDVCYEQTVCLDNTTSATVSDIVYPVFRGNPTEDQIEPDADWFCKAESSAVGDSRNDSYGYKNSSRSCAELILILQPGTGGHRGPGLGFANPHPRIPCGDFSRIGRLTRDCDPDGEI